MKKFITTLIIIAAFFSNAFALHGEWQIISIPSPSLENCLFGDNSETEIGVYLPPSYAEVVRNYPVVYFLEGYGGEMDPSGYVANILESLITQYQVPEMIFVAISGAYHFRGSFYTNSPVTGNWMDFVAQDVVSYVDKHYRTLPKNASRALTGMSMGGFGVLNISMQHPEIFGLAYSMSPGLFDPNGLMNSQMFKNGGTMAEITELIKELKPLSKKAAHQAYMEYVKNIEDWNIEFTLAYAMAFAPNPKKAPYFDYPFKISKNDTIVNKKVLAKWESGFGGVDEELRLYAYKLAQLKLLALDCGYNDHYQWIIEGTQYYSDLLTKKRIPHSMTWNSGDHGSKFTEQMRTKVFPMVGAAMEFEK